MSSAVSEKRVVRYYSQDHGWSENEHSDTKFRMVSVCRERHHALVENQLWAPNPRGGWTEVTGDDEARLQGFERGFVFETKPRRSEAGTFLEIRPMRYLDSDMVQHLLQGIQLFDADLRPAEPAVLNEVFCLGTAEAQTFMARVHQLGGQITEAQADVQGMYAKASRIHAISTELAELCRMSRAVIDQVASGVHTEAPSISERCRAAAMLREQAVELLKDLRDEYAMLERNADQLELRAHGQAYIENSETWVTHIERLAQEHKSYEVQAVQRIKANISLPVPDAGSASRRYLMMPLVQYYTNAGYDARLTEEGMILRLGDHVIELTDRPRIISPETQAAAEVAFGRGEVQRGHREL